MSTGGLESRGVLGSSGGLLSRGGPGIGVGLWSTCGPWSTDVLGKYVCPVVGVAPGIEGVRQIVAVHLRGSCLRMVTYH